MSADATTCPQCQSVVMLDFAPLPGAIVQCPQCRCCFSPGHDGERSAWLLPLLAVGGAVGLVTVLIVVALALTRPERLDEPPAAAVAIEPTLPAETRLADPPAVEEAQANDTQEKIVAEEPVQLPPPVAEPAVPAPPGEMQVDDPPQWEYNWETGKEYAYHFNVRTTIAGQPHNYNGWTYYTPEDPELIKQLMSHMTETIDSAATTFVIHPDGYLATSAHVVHGAVRIVVPIGQRRYVARVVALDRRNDLAILQVDARDLPVLPLANAEIVQAARDVRAVGYPLSDALGSSVKVVRGTVQEIVEPRGAALLQIGGFINPGNSGGPVVNMQGQVVGITKSAIFDPEIARVGFAVSTEKLRDLMQKVGIPVKEADRGAAEMAGPELAAQVTPSVLTLDVTTSPTGIGMARPHVLKFKGNLSLQVGVPDPTDIDFFDSNNTEYDDGTLILDSLGEVFVGRGKLNVPLVMMPVAHMGLETLPPTDEPSWQSVRVTTVTQTHQIGGPREQTMPGRRAPGGLYPRPDWQRGLLRPPVTASETPSIKIVREHLALERVLYEVIENTDQRLVFSKHTQLATLAEDGQQPYTRLVGQGTIVFDRTLGVLTGYTGKATLHIHTDGKDQRYPIDVTCMLRGHTAPPLDMKLDFAELAEELTSSADLDRKFEILQQISLTPPNETHQKAIAAALESLLGSPNPDLRMRTIEALTGWGTADSVLKLRDLVLHPDPPTGLAAAMSLTKFDRDVALATVVDLLQDEQKRGPALLVFRKTDAAFAERLLVPLIDYHEGGVQAMALLILADVQGEALLPELLRRLNGRMLGSGERRLLAEVYLKIRPDEPLARVWSRQPDPPSLIGTDALVDQALGLLKSPTRQAGQIFEALMMLAGMSTVAARRDEVAQALDSLLDYPRAEIRVWAFRLMPYWGSPANLPTLIRISRHGETLHKWAAISTLGLFDDPQAAYAIAFRIEEPAHRSVAMRAASALLSRRPSPAVVAILKDAM